MAALVQLGLAFSVGMAAAQEVTNSTLLFSWSQTAAAMPLPPDLCGLSIETDRWPDWAGNVSQKNDFTYTLLNNLKVKTGIAPPIRIGGGTQGSIIFTPDLPPNPGFYNVFPPVPPGATGAKQLFPEASFTGAAYDYYLCAGNLPAGTEFTWGINFDFSNMSETIVQVREVDRAFADPFCKDVKLRNIEMGNEIDSIGLTIWNYTETQIEYFSGINNALRNNGRKYRVADWAKYWTTEQLLATGIMESPMGPFINAYSEHHYQSDAEVTGEPSGVPGTAVELINKANIRTNLAPYTISAVDAKKAGLPFVLGETGTFSGHGFPGVSNTAAAALWMVDYSLQAASVGISGLYFHNGIGYNYSSFEPLDHIGINITDFPPSARRHILPQYYGYLVVADAIGNSGNAFVNELWTDNSSLAAYQIWEGPILQRIVLINEVGWTNVSEGTRPVIAVNIPGLAGRLGVKYKLLDFSSIDDLDGLTWGGQSWENYEGTATGPETFEELDSDGTVNMQASSAVLIYINATIIK